MTADSHKQTPAVDVQTVTHLTPNPASTNGTPGNCKATCNHTAKACSRTHTVLAPFKPPVVVFRAFSQ